MMVRSVDRGKVENWWWKIERFLIEECMEMMGIGIIM